MTPTNTFMLLFEGTAVGTATYQGGMLRTVVLSTANAGEVAAVMALLPSRESYLNGEHGMLSAVNLQHLEVRHAQG